MNILKRMRIQKIYKNFHCKFRKTLHTLAKHEKNAKNRVDRKKITAEDFTPPSLVNDMLEKLQELDENNFIDSSKTFIDPACGNGNMLVEILKKKLFFKHDSLTAIQTIFGVDIKDDNVNETRLRLLKVLKENNVKITKEHVRFVLRNIRVARLSAYENGALDYFDGNEFDNKDSQEHIDKWMYDVKNGVLDDFSLFDMEFRVDEKCGKVTIFDV